MAGSVAGIRVVRRCGGFPLDGGRKRSEVPPIRMSNPFFRFSAIPLIAAALPLVSCKKETSVPVSAAPAAEVETKVAEEKPEEVKKDSDLWTVDYKAALADAKATGKDVLLDFTGSDWCTICVVLKKEVFDQKIFDDGVRGKWALVKLDFPHNKEGMSQATLEQNDQLAKEYLLEEMQGFPTIFLTDADGKPFAVTGYLPGGPQNYVNHLNEMRERKAVRDNGFKRAGEMEGVDKARQLVNTLSVMGLPPVVAAKFYPEVIEQIKAADPNDETGYIRKDELRQRMKKLEMNIGEYLKAENYEGAYSLIETFLKSDGLDDEARQVVVHARAMLQANQGRWVDAIHSLDDAKAILPSSQLGMAIDKMRRELEGQNGSPVPPKN